MIAKLTGAPSGSLAATVSTAVVFSATDAAAPEVITGSSFTFVTLIVSSWLSLCRPLSLTVTSTS